MNKVLVTVHCLVAAQNGLNFIIAVVSRDEEQHLKVQLKKYLCFQYLLFAQKFR